MKRKTLVLHAGGLYRCCVQSFEEWVAEAPEAEVAEGEKLTCRYDKSETPTQMIASGKTMRWLVPDHPPIPKAAP